LTAESSFPDTRGFPAWASKYPFTWTALIFPVILLALLTLTIGLGAESLLLLASRAAEQLMDPTEYISRVLGEMR
jgi:formate hydrogenlyase subunit 3/multisubunit Na+/H+ antiporter MnhD subunit